MNVKKLRAMVGSDWEDIMQEAKINCLKHEGTDYYERYLARSVQNLSYNLLRHRKTIKILSLDELQGRNSKILEDSDSHSYNPDYGAIYDLKRFMRSRWSQEERDLIFLFFTGQISTAIAAERAKKSKTDMHRWLSRVKETFIEEMSAYVL